MQKIKDKVICVIWKGMEKHALDMMVFRKILLPNPVAAAAAPILFFIACHLLCILLYVLDGDRTHRCEFLVSDVPGCHANPLIRKNCS